MLIRLLLVGLLWRRSALWRLGGRVASGLLALLRLRRLVTLLLALWGLALRELLAPSLRLRELLVAVGVSGVALLVARLAAEREAVATTPLLATRLSLVLP